ncbi:MAG: hypothetical protein DRQ49_06190 [Gammaproteobacteria bacterium]|nr:MAG: hypothetical protein DRQ49_06190 [Gammaproteobacteria bacterium]RKZ44862.1 MAG: hypothetical protein DRQ41_01710 [Gammaproteobacteria bacterium]RKZ74598.1 MAG: hypothetical protein DRQ57_10430 [Gammaproteobacteria bacterium]
MKKISSYTVMLEEIKSPDTRAKFSEADLNEAAELILQMEGVITPLILLEVGIDSYSIIEGDFEYYAALKAEKIDPLKCEGINAYLIESEEELPFYQQQIAMFRKQSVVTPVEKPVEKTGESEKEPAISTQTSTVDIQPIMNVIKNLSEQFTGFVSQQSKRDAEVDKIFNVLQEAIANISVAPLETTIISQPEKQTVFVADFNNKGISDFEFEIKLNRIGITARFTTPILAERGKRTLNSFADFKIKGVGKGTINKILNNWS